MGISNSTGSAAPAIFVTGASGYIGGRLVPRLLERGYRVRCLARSPKKLESRPWANEPTVEIVGGDVGDTEALTSQMRGCSAAYYLVHSMLAAGPAYASKDAELARSFSAAAAEAGCERILYLGGLGETGEGLSEHLSSRRETEALLAATSVPVTVLRAAMIIGAGSASFEILRYLVERLPVMVTPRWVQTECQPIAVRNVIEYLLDALVMDETKGQTLDIGGPEVLSYRDMMAIMAEALGLRHRLVIPVPVLTPRLSSLWIHLVTPLSHHIARPLAEGLRNRVVCRDDTAQRLMPQPLIGVREAIDEALGRMKDGDVETSWTDAGAVPGDPDWAGGTTYEHVEETEVKATAPQVFRALCRIGGLNGWYAVDFLWKLRGFIDQLLGGPGLQRGRRHAEVIRHGDALDFWRVTGLERDRWLKLRAEMVVPGEAVLEFRIDPDPQYAGRCRLHQIARFKPKGLMGILYWYSVLPFHGIVFRNMIRGIQSAAEQIEMERWVEDSNRATENSPTIERSIFHRENSVDEKTTQIFEQSLRRCDSKPDFLDIFYEKFLASSPKVAERFADTDFHRQKRLLRASFYMILLASEDPENGPEQYLSHMAARHSAKDLDVGAELYDLWLDSLLASVKECDPDYDEEVEHAWEKMMGVGIDFLLSRYHHS